MTKGALLLDILDNVKSRVVEVRREGGKWRETEAAVPANAHVSVTALDRDTSDDYWMTVTGFTEPTTLYLAKAGGAREKVKSLPAQFDAKGLVTTQYEATSKDGTKVPYFVVTREGTKMDGTNPTILYGYGGFEISMLPGYSGTIGTAWLERGGVYVLANIRGGGEFGPAWHTPAMRENRQQDATTISSQWPRTWIKRKLTSPKHLGIMGGSQGGLLVGSDLHAAPGALQRGGLPGAAPRHAALQQAPRRRLLDGRVRRSRRARRLGVHLEVLAVPERRKDEKYPRVFFYTSTRDDRVHPGHARKMVAKMEAQGHDVLYYENTEGGHAAGTTPAQQAYMWALTYTFLWNELR